MSRKVLIGSTNPSKITWLSEYLSDIPGMECVTLKELGVTIEPSEEGRTPEENALLKALAYHEATGLSVISHDSGLYFREFPMDDSRQPGLYIRRVGGVTLNDNGMMDYYSGLAKQYGPLHGCYCSGFAAVDENGQYETFAQDRMENDWFVNTFGFLMVAQPHPMRHPGWPLDSLSKDLKTGEYWFDQEDDRSTAESDCARDYRRNVNRFFRDFLTRETGDNYEFEGRLPEIQ